MVELRWFAERKDGHTSTTLQYRQKLNVTIYAQSTTWSEVHITPNERLEWSEWINVPTVIPIPAVSND